MMYLQQAADTTIEADHPHTKHLRKSCAVRIPPLGQNTSPDRSDDT